MFWSKRVSGEASINVHREESGPGLSTLAQSTFFAGSCHGAAEPESAHAPRDVLKTAKKVNTTLIIMIIITIIIIIIIIIIIGIYRGSRF